MSKRKRTVLKNALLLLIAVLLFFLCCTSFTGCSREIQVGDVYDRVVYLIEKSYEINTVIYGPGLPSYVRGSDFSELNHIYFGLLENGSYEYVTERSKFQSVDEIKARAEKVYSKGFLEDVIYKTLFDGYAVEDGAGGAVVGLARYGVVGDKFTVNVERDEDGIDKNILFTSMRIYDYSTMQVRSLGREDACVVSMDSILPETPDKVENVELKLALQDGEWYLDSFSGA